MVLLAAVAVHRSLKVVQNQEVHNLVGQKEVAHVLPAVLTVAAHQRTQQHSAVQLFLDVWQQRVDPLEDELLHQCQSRVAPHRGLDAAAYVDPGLWLDPCHPALCLAGQLVLLKMADQFQVRPHQCGRQEVAPCAVLAVFVQSACRQDVLLEPEEAQLVSSLLSRSCQGGDLHKKREE